MSRVFNITIDYEPERETETRYDLKTDDWGYFPIEGWRGRITIDSRCCETFGGKMMFDIRRKPEPKDVLEAEIDLLKAMRSDIDDAIKELTKRVGR